MQSTVPVGVFSHMRSVILVGVLVATPAAAGATQLHHGGWWLMPLALAGVAIVLARATSSIDA